MKKLRVLNALTIAVFTLAFTACSNDDDNSNGNGAAEGQLIATVDGNDYSSSDTNVGATFFNGLFNITALNPTTNEVILVTVNGAAEGTFDLGPDNGGTAVGSYNINGENAFLSVAEGGSGTITITKLDTENNLASGTFEFVGTRELTTGETETVTISGGAFTDVFLTTQIGGNPNNSFEAEVDGVAMNPDAINAVEITFQGETTISITALNNTTNQNIGISIPADTEVGTYEFSSFPTSGAIVGQYNPDLGGSGSTAYSSIDGTITITAYDTAAGTMEGTFEFTAGDFTGQNPETYEITNGVFSVEF